MSFLNNASVSKSEVERFSALADSWWNLNGVFRMLHRLNPLRIDYALGQIRAHGIAEGWTHLDIGCGGGLFAEEMAKHGAKVTGLDVSIEAIEVARKHAELSNLGIDYRVGSIEALVEAKERFDVITALEVVEHVADLKSFLTAAVKLLKPNGLLIIATMNRTKSSFLLGVLAAEYVLGWVPRGTHDWDKFVRPSELVRRLEGLGMVVEDATGVIYNPLKNAFEIKKNRLEINYLLTARKS